MVILEGQAGDALWRPHVVKNTHWTEITYWVKYVFVSLASEWIIHDIFATFIVCQFWLLT